MCSVNTSVRFVLQQQLFDVLKVKLQALSDIHRYTLPNTDGVFAVYLGAKGVLVPLIKTDGRVYDGHFAT